MNNLFLKTSIVCTTLLNASGLFFLGSPVAAASPDSAPLRPSTAQQQIESIMVGMLDLDSDTVSEGESRSISTRLRNFLNQQNIFEVIERQKMTEIMEEVGFQLSGACNTDEGGHPPAEP